MTAVDALLTRSSYRFAAGVLALGATVPGAAAMLRGVGAESAYVGFLSCDPGTASEKWPFVLGLYLFFPATLAGTVLWGRWHARGPLSGGRPARVPKALVAASFCLVVGAGAWFTLDTLTRSELQIDYYSEHERWAEALKAADRLPAGWYNVRCHRNTMLALYHTGRLGDEMFRYPQMPGTDLYFTPREYRDPGSSYQESRLFLELGEVNHAELCAYEAFADLGEQPAVLRQLAMINAVKGRMETACVFWKALEKHPLYQRTARGMLDCLEADPGLDDDPLVRTLRANMLDKDHQRAGINLEESLRALLKKNPQNRLAFELLMAYYLAARRPDAVAANLWRFRDLSYPRIPRHYQEAMIVDAEKTGRPLADVAEFDPELRRQYREFQRMCRTAPGPHAAAAAALAAGLGDSYFFYFTFSVSGR